MSDVVNRTTGQYLKSVNTPDYPEADWIINPDLSALAGVPGRYWKISGDRVLEMTRAERDAVDSAARTARDVAADMIEHTDNADAVAAGLSVGEKYRTGDALKIVHL